MKQLAIAAVILACNASAATLVNPGFEDTGVGPLEDGGDNGVWRSFSNGTNTWTINEDQARSGTKSLMSGTVGNARQSFFPDVAGSQAGTENLTFTLGAWIYYDTNAGSTPGDALNLELSVRNNWNIINSYVGKQVNSQVNPGNITANTWTYFELSMTTSTFDPSEGGDFAVGSEQYNNRITDRISIVFGVPLNTSDGKFFIDDVSVTAIPEPGAALLGGLGMLALFRRRRA